MFHLFNKTYLELDYLYTSLHDGIIASSKFVEDPLFPNHLTNTVSLDSLIEDKYESSYEAFWCDIWSKGLKRRFYVYLEFKELCRLQVVLWKSTLRSPDFENCYLLHRVYIQDFLIKNYLYSDNVEDKDKYFNSDVAILSKNEFKVLFDEAKISRFLAKKAKDEASFEMLLANYLAADDEDNDFSYKKQFLTKVAYFSLKFLKEEIKILKGDMANGIYDFAKKGLQIQSLDDSIDGFIHLVKSDKNLMWVLDENIAGADLEYLADHYGPEVFITFMKVQAEIYSKKDLKNEKLFEELIEDQVVKMIRAIFKKDYLRVLEIDINKGFGSYLFNNSSGHKINLILISHLYDLYRDNNISEIKRFMVS